MSVMALPDVSVMALLVVSIVALPDMGVVAHFYSSIVALVDMSSVALKCMNSVALFMGTLWGGSIYEHGGLMVLGMVALEYMIIVALVLVALLFELLCKYCGASLYEHMAGV